MIRCKNPCAALGAINGSRVSMRCVGWLRVARRAGQQPFPVAFRIAGERAAWCTFDADALS